MPRCFQIILVLLVCLHVRAEAQQQCYMNTPRTAQEYLGVPARMGPYPALHACEEANRTSFHGNGQCYCSDTLPHESRVQARAKLVDALEARWHEVGRSSTTDDPKVLLLSNILTGFLTVLGAGDDWGEPIAFANSWDSVIRRATTALVTRRATHHDEAQTVSATAARLERKSREFTPEYAQQRAARLEQELTQLPMWIRALEDQRRRADSDAGAIAARLRQQLGLPIPAHLGSAPSTLQTRLEEAAVPRRA